MKILSVIGARPQFVKAAMVSRAIRKTGGLREKILHTGQHYDFRMSEIFFREMGIPRPYRNLGVGSAAHGAQTAKMLLGIERECLKEKPRRPFPTVRFYGDGRAAGRIAGILAPT